MRTDTQVVLTYTLALRTCLYLHTGMNADTYTHVCVVYIYMEREPPMEVRGNAWNIGSFRQNYL